MQRNYQGPNKIIYILPASHLVWNAIKVLQNNLRTYYKQILWAFFIRKLLFSQET